MRDEYRCGVVGELRGLAKGYADIPAWNVIACGELPPPIDDALHACGLGRAVHVSEICDRLADLIEPEPERTCRDIAEPPKGGGFWPAPHFKCSECGGEHVSIDYVSYCPKCGAKVVGDE